MSAARILASAACACLAVVLVLACSSSSPTNDVFPPGSVANFTATPASGGASLSWVAPGDADFRAVLVARFSGTPDGAPVPGAIYVVGNAIGSGTVVFVGSGSSTTDTVADGCYTYAAWAMDSARNWSALPATDQVEIGAAANGPSAHPTGLAAVVSGTNVSLTWTNPPASSGFTEIRLVRSGSAPTGPSSGTLVYRGTATSFADSLTSLVALQRTWYAVYACNGCGTCETTGATASVTPTMAQALKAGGYVIHWRHADATVCVDRTDLGLASNTSSPGWWRSCETNCAIATARQVDATGVTHATTIGTDMRARGIPIGRVISSEFCRNVMTAQLMAFAPPTELNTGITYYVYGDQNRCPATMGLLRQPPPAGSNTAIIGHAGFTCPPVDGLAWASADIFRPDGAGNTIHIGRVAWSEWATLP